MEVKGLSLSLTFLIGYTDIHTVNKGKDMHQNMLINA
jgi:hypothetical protein